MVGHLVHSFDGKDACCESFVIELNHGTQKADHIIPAQHSQNLIACYDGQLVDAVPTKGIWIR